MKRMSAEWMKKIVSVLCAGAMILSPMGNMMTMNVLAAENDAVFEEEAVESAEETIAAEEKAAEDMIVADGERKIDVWDFGCQLEEDTTKYTNNITNDVIKGLVDAKRVGASDKMISGTDDLVIGDLVFKSNGSNDYLQYDKFSGEYADGYTGTLALYTNGKASSSKRYITIDNVKKDDKIVVYASLSSAASNYIFTGVDEGMTQNESVDVALGAYEKLEFVAESDGKYKLYEDNKGKTIIHRVERIPSSVVNGTIDLGGNAISDFGLKFVDVASNNEKLISVSGNTVFSVVLPADAEYKTLLIGASGYAIDKESRQFKVEKTAGVNGGSVNGVTVKVVQQPTYTFKGKISGFADGYDISKLQIFMVPEDKDLEEIELNINSSLEFTAQLLPENKYSFKVEGVNDYQIKDAKDITSAGTNDVTENITMALKEKHTAKGGFINAAEVKDLTFTNVEDGYKYTAEIKDGKYSVSLRDGAYEASSSSGNTFTHVVVKGADVEKDIYFDKAAAASMELKKDLYVGENGYATVSEAVSAAAAMKPASEEQRITIHIAPGVYREQIKINTPYISLVNDTDKEVLLTWYYGIGYTYYSADKTGYYNPASAYDKFDRKPVATWGSAVYVGKEATGFRASGISFENSFNKYVTAEEIADGVEADPTAYSDTKITLKRAVGTDVRTKAATERATAIAVYADKAEFDNCSFTSSQDTVYTGSTAGTRTYFKNCFIEGQTDYIFGYNTAVFDNCVLSFCGYSAASQGGYITAVKTEGTDGYLFRSCSVVASDEKGMDVKPGYFGRPWGANANVLFLNTQLQSESLIEAAGWTDMSSNKAGNAKFKEFGTTTFEGANVSTAGRVAGTVLSSAADYTMTKYLGDWKPACYKEKTGSKLSVEGAVSIVDNGDLNTPYPGHTITVVYSLGEYDDEDISSIKWYRVNGDSETLVKASTATVSKSYKITKEDIGANLKVVVSPKTLSGLTADAVTQNVEKPVLDGYDDPENPGADPSLGEGVNVFLVGDSTVRDYSDKCVWSSSAQNLGSWGEFLQTYFNNQVTVVNYANGGRSTRNYLNEGSLDKVDALMGEGDYLFIQFGHNDCAYQDTYKADRYVPIGTPDANGVYPVTEGVKGDDGKYTWDCGGTYKWFLKQYVERAKAKGAIPVLVTPVARMYYTADGTIKPHHDDNTSSNNAYVTAVKQLAEEEDVLCIDAFELTKEMYEAAYKACGSDKYGFLAMSSLSDKTHNNKLGGMIEAAVMAKAIKSLNINISNAIVTPKSTGGYTIEGEKVFSVDDAGKFTAYDMSTNYADEIAFWSEYGQNLFKEIDEIIVDLANKDKENDTTGVQQTLTADDVKSQNDKKAEMTANKADAVINVKQAEGDTLVVEDTMKRGKTKSLKITLDTEAAEDKILEGDYYVTLNAGSKYNIEGEFKLVSATNGEEITDAKALKKLAAVKAKKGNTSVSLKAVKTADIYGIHLQSMDGKANVYIKTEKLSLDKKLIVTPGDAKEISLKVGANEANIKSAIWTCGKDIIPTLKAAEVSDTTVKSIAKGKATAYVDAATGKVMVKIAENVKGSVKLTATVNKKKYSITLKIVKK